MEEAIDIAGTQPRCEQQEPCQTAIAKKTRVDQTGEAIILGRESILGDVLNDGGANAKVKKAVIIGNRENQNPDAEGIVSQPVQDEGGKKKPDQNRHGESKPVRADVPKRLYPEIYHIVRPGVTRPGQVSAWPCALRCRTLILTRRQIDNRFRFAADVLVQKLCATLYAVPQHRLDSPEVEGHY